MKQLQQSKAHSFCFGRKSKPTSVAQESKRQVGSPNAPFRFALAGTNAIGIVCVLCKKDRFLAVIFVETKPPLSALGATEATAVQQSCATEACHG